MNHVSTLLALTVALQACGNDYQVVEDTIEAKLRWHQEPGEIQDCHVFKLDNASTVEVDRLQVKFPEGSHHVHLYRSSEPAADEVYDCFKGIDWTKWSLLIGAQTRSMDWTLPEGTTIPLEPHQQLLAQVHWLNSTNEAIEPEVDLSFHTTEYSEQHLGVLFGVNQRVNVAPGQHARFEDWCPLPDGANLIAMMGHFHQHGSDYRVTERKQDETGGPVVYESPDEPGFQFKIFNPARPVAPGAGLEYGCSFFNYGSQQLTWGSDTRTQEHCNMTAYYAPATTLSTLCLQSPSKLKAVRSSQDVVRAGEQLVFDVELAAAEATDVTVALGTSDPTVMTVPSTVIVPAGKLHATFTAHALRPAFAEVRASVTGATVSSQIRVSGLVISELFYEPASGDGHQRQWIELSNQTDLPIDLSKYSIGAGKTDFMRTRLALPMSIPAHGCIVVGGPQSDATNYFPPFALASDLSPDLGLGGEMADGVGLFATTMAGITTASRPLDVLVYAGTDTHLVGPDGNLAPVWPATEPGESLRRVTDTVWSRASNPNPGTCEVANAY
jgi:hypothetical protein